MILLQNDGLTLKQLNTIISYQLPSIWSGKHAWLIALVLLIMVPSGFIAPVLSGAIDWKPAVRYEYAAPVRRRFGPSSRGTECVWNNLMAKNNERLVCNVEHSARPCQCCLDRSDYGSQLDQPQGTPICFQRQGPSAEYRSERCSYSSY